MSTLIQKINTADRLWTMVRQGFMAPITMTEQLAGAGFYEIDAEAGTARLDGVLYRMQEVAPW